MSQKTVMNLSRIGKTYSEIPSNAIFKTSIANGIATVRIADIPTDHVRIAPPNFVKIGANPVHNFSNDFLNPDNLSLTLETRFCISDLIISVANFKFAKNPEITFPEKIKLPVQIPHSNEVYDFSTICGTQNYKERTYTIVFGIVDRTSWTKESLYIQWTKIVPWLVGPDKKTPLYDNVMKQYYYLGEVQKSPGFKELGAYGTLTVEFQCSPFRIHTLQEGNDVWDSYNFELDIAQRVNYTIRQTTTITVQNVGISTIAPTVVASSNMEIQRGDERFTVRAGSSKVTGFYLMTGANILKITGNGTIEFKFHKEVI